MSRNRASKSTVRPSQLAVGVAIGRHPGGGAQQHRLGLPAGGVGVQLADHRVGPAGPSTRNTSARATPCHSGAELCQSSFCTGVRAKKSSSSAGSAWGEGDGLVAGGGHPFGRRRRVAGLRPPAARSGRGENAGLSVDPGIGDESGLHQPVRQRGVLVASGGRHSPVTSSAVAT